MYLNFTFIDLINLKVRIYFENFGSEDYVLFIVYTILVQAIDDRVRKFITLRLT